MAKSDLQHFIFKFGMAKSDLQHFIFKFGRAELTNAHHGDWTGLNFVYAVIIVIRIKK